LTFGSPLALVGLVVLPLLVALYVVHERRRTKYAARWGTPALLPNVIDRAPGRLRYLPLAILLAALAALIVGVARPHATVSVRREEATVLLAMDVSRSMGAADVKPTRLGAAKRGALQFVSNVPKKFRVGVVAFGSDATVAVAPTTDRALVRTAIEGLRTGEGTAIGDAVLLCATLGRRLRTSDGVVPPIAVLLVSDGARDGGRATPQAAARRARSLHVPVYTVLLGTPNGVVEHRLTGGYREIIRVPPDPRTLRMLARTTGGKFFVAPSNETLKQVYEQLSSRRGHKREPRELTDLFAGGSALLLFVGGALSALWFRRVP
jgi:Ca-activated chloride channel family protein